MKTEKREDYIKNLYAAVHTLSGQANYVNLHAAKTEATIKTAYQKQDYYYLQLNPNKVTHISMLKTYSEFKSVLDAVLEQVEAKDFKVTRADLAFNSDVSGDYELFKKLNKLLICCIAQAYNVQNCYQASDLWSNESLSISIKNDRMEAENYNKEKEAHGQTEAKNRLELRSKRMTGSIKDEFMLRWFERLDQAILQFQSVQDRYNRELLRIWKADRLKPKKEQDFVSVTAFLLRFKDSIFTRSQLQSLLEEIGVPNPKNTAKKFKDNHKIEFYSLNDLKIIVKALKQAALTYFNN